MGAEGLIPISFASKEMPRREFDELKNSVEGGVESEEFCEALLEGISYLFSLGLENKLREQVKESISLIKYGVKEVDPIKKQKNTVNVRMVSGDHVETCRWAAL